MPFRCVKPAPGLQHGCVPQRQTLFSLFLRSLTRALIDSDFDNCSVYRESWLETFLKINPELDTAILFILRLLSAYPTQEYKCIFRAKNIIILDFVDIIIVIGSTVEYTQKYL